MLPNTLDSQYELIKDWGIAKDAIRLNPHSQRIPIDKSVGDGYFERYEFMNGSLSRLHCKFRQTKQLINQNCQTAYTIHFTLQGSCKIDLKGPVSDKQKTLLDHIDLVAPTLWLMKGNIGHYSTTISADEDIKAFYIELNDEFVDKITTQLQPKNDFQHCLLAKLISTDGYICLPTTFNLQNENIIKNAWTLFNTLSPTDEMSFMTLQGQTLLFISDILMQRYDELLLKTEHNNYSHAQQAKLLLEQYYYQNWTIRELANKAGTNECYLKSEFKQLTQQTVGQYRTSKRLEMAHKMLLKGEKLAQVARRTGFNSDEYFIKVFKKHYGYHPNACPSIQTNNNNKTI